MAMFKPEEITYELFDIDPGEFYKEKMRRRPTVPALPLDSPDFKYRLSYHEIRLMVEKLRESLPDGGDILDVGCGSGPLGPIIRANIPGARLFGIDMDGSVEEAFENGYTDCKCRNLLENLPYPDARFDAVISSHLLGHIEFKHKDGLISEMSRITRDGGVGFHGAETGFIDYFTCNPKDSEDRIRKYVYIDGHVGVEPARHLLKRFEKFFSKVEWDITYLYPFIQLPNMSFFEEEFTRMIDPLKTDSEAISTVDLVFGRLNTYFIELYKKVLGETFQPGDDPNDKDCSVATRKLCHPAGFASFFLRK